MLTATYTLVALSVEQARVRNALQSLQELLHASLIHQSALTSGQTSVAAEAVKRLYDSSHWRKIDLFLVPAIRSATDQANTLLHDLDDLARTAADAVSSTAARLGSAAMDTPAAVSQFCHAIDTFCSASLRRLEREEHDLFPMARAVISGEVWFAIANKMMAHDAHMQDRKYSRDARAPAQVRLAGNAVHTAGQAGTPTAATVIHAATPNIAPKPAPKVTHTVNNPPPNAAGYGPFEEPADPFYTASSSSSGSTSEGAGGNTDADDIAGAPVLAPAHAAATRLAPAPPPWLGGAAAGRAASGSGSRASAEQPELEQQALDHVAH